MKKLLLIFALSAWTSGVFAAIEVGSPAPDFTGTDIQGKTLKLSDYKGKVVVLEAYNSDCPFCANHFQSGAMQELQKEMTSQGVIWLMVNSVHVHHSSYRTPEQAQAEWKSQKINATAWLDDHAGTIGKLYGMKTTPHMFVIDTAGLLRYQGAIDDRPSTYGDPRQARNYVREAVKAILAGQKVPVTQTKSYGCGVHYGG